MFVQHGYKEIDLTGADITSYPGGLVPLLECLLKEVPEIERLRLGSLDPGALDESFIALAKKYPQIMPYFHLSIQAGDNMVLKRMGRRHTKEQVLHWIESMRSVRPNAVFGADFIAGFPTETDEQFESTLDLIRLGNITHLHVFPYSERPGTPAAKMPQVPVPVRKKRATKIRELGEKLQLKLLESMVGKTVPVLVEGNKTGLTDNYIRVILNKEFSEGTIVPVQVKGVKENALVG